MKKAWLVGFCILAHLFCCLSGVVAQRSPVSDTGRIRLLLETALSYVYRPGSLKTDMDSARVLVSKAMQLNSNVGSPEWEGKSAYVCSNIFREEGNNAKGKEYAEKAIEHLLKSNKKLDLANSYVELARYYDPYNDNDLKEKIRLNEQAARYFAQAGQKQEQANTVKHIGELLIFEGNAKKALVQLKEAVKIFRELQYKELQGVYDLICNACRQMGDYSQALEYGLLALKTAQTQKDSSGQLSAIYNHIGATLYYLDKPAEAATYYEKGILVTARNKDSTATITIVHNLANAYTNANQVPIALALLKSIEKRFPLNSLYDRVTIYTSLLSAYTNVKKYDSAKIYYRRLVDISAGNNVTIYLTDIYSAYIKYFMAVKQFTEAAKYCALNEQLCRQVGFVNKLMLANYRSWYKADSALGHFDSALLHYQKLVALNDSLFNEAKARQISELQIQYETEKKDNDILLLTNQDQLQKNELRQVSLIRKVSMAAVILLIIVVVLLYNRSRLKQKANRQLEQNQREINQKNEELTDMLAQKEWWLREVHHRVKNNLHTIICLLESQAMYLEKDALQAIEKSQHRIYAMSLIHQKLYQNEDVQVIDMQVYLEEFIGYLKDSFDTKEMDFIINVDPVHLNLQQAIPVALIINEGVTNAIKYAFGNESEPEIQISMTETDEVVTLMIKDNGRGFEVKAEDEGKSLGMQLIKGLSKELKGMVNFDTHAGTNLVVEFKKGPPTDRMAYMNSNSVEQ